MQAVQLGQKQRRKRKMKQEKKLKTIDMGKIGEEFPDLSDSKQEQLRELLEGKAVGCSICHVWFEEGNQILYKLQN